MDNINRFNLTITTGRVSPQPTSQNQNPKTQNGESFDAILKQKLSQSGVNFTKHAQNRIDQRGIDISTDKVERLNKGMELAREKGLEDVLVLVDKTAFIVNAKSSTVITTVGSEESQGNVFTNIQGTVII
ncbi:MAG: TIGR02530 family flagellar biosynthesis protein [Oscillospiraceae bacterium]